MASRLIGPRSAQPNQGGILQVRILLDELRTFQSRDVVFLEDQTIEDFEKVEKPKPVTENYVDLGPVPPTTVNDDNGGDVQEDDGNTVDEPALDNDVPDEHVEQAPPEPPVERLAVDPPAI